MKTYVPFIVFTCFALTSIAQKKSLTHQDYAHWKRVEESGISPNGGFLYYTANPQKGDGTLWIKSSKGDTLGHLPRGFQVTATHNSAAVIYKISPQLDSVRLAKLEKTPEEKLPKDSLGIWFRDSETEWKYPDLMSYKVPEKWAGWIAFLQHEKEDSTSQKADSLKTEQQDAPTNNGNGKKEDVKTGLLNLLNIVDSSHFTMENVHYYTIAPEGKMAFFLTSSKDSAIHSAAYAYNFEDKSLSLLDSSQVHYANISSDRWGNQAAYIATSDSIDADFRQYRIFHWNKGADNIQLIKLSGTDYLHEDWAVSQHRAPVFSYDGNRIFLGVAPKVLKTEYEKDTTILEEERVKVDVWTWKDPYLQPQQLKEREEELKKNYMGCFDLTGKTFTMLANPNIPEIIHDEKFKLDKVVGVTREPYAQMISWEWPYYQDFYLIDVKNGKRTLIKKKSKGDAEISPSGKYVYWFERTDGHWYTYNTSNGEIVNISKDTGVAFYQEDHDTPNEASSYGVAGWAENDDYLLVYDQYDIWALAPSGKRSSYIVSDTLGRKNQWRFRYNKLDEEQEFISYQEGLILSVTDLKTRASGFYRDSVKNGFTAQKLAWDDYLYYDLKKSKNAGQLTYRKGSFQDFPDLYATNHFFNEPKKVSHINPQQDEYLWGSAEFISWYSFDGDSLSGIVYKPENFDPGKKYPMVVYFYEKYSDRFHRHYVPTASRSIVNFPYLTSNDYVVFVPDIVYKDGYPGMSAYNCIMPGVNKLVQSGYVDEKRIGIQGQSWGGYQVAYLVTRTGFFRAAMAGAPVSNMTSAYGGIRWGTGLSRMFQYETTQSRIGGTLWDKHMLYIENSPLFYADRVSTPLLMMHNDADGAVPWYQGIEYFVALRRLQNRYGCWYTMARNIT
jgi:dipeptidyl aminopeptidase/acylaminoacyl peptidase